MRQAGIPHILQDRPGNGAPVAGHQGGRHGTGGARQLPPDMLRQIAPPFHYAQIQIRAVRRHLGSGNGIAHGANLLEPGGAGQIISAGRGWSRGGHQNRAQADPVANHEGRFGAVAQGQSHQRGRPPARTFRYFAFAQGQAKATRPGFNIDDGPG